MPKPSLSDFLLVFVGGGIGASLRYGVSLLLRLTGGFFLGTLTVNIVGAFLVGAVMAWVTAVEPHPGWRLFLVVGIMGGFTTFSSLAYECLLMLQKGAMGLFAAYVLGTVSLGLAACWAGFEAARLALKG